MNREVHVRICESRGLRRPRLLDRHGDPSPQHAHREQLKLEIRRLFAKHRGTYGSPRITADLREQGWRVSENTVAALMRELGLAARRRRRRKQTTRPGRGRWRAPDLIGRDFGTDRLNHKWYGDGTEIPTDEGKLYLDSVLDMGSRRIVGFAVGEHHDSDLATAALQMAVAIRGGKDALAGVIMHTDNSPSTRRRAWLDFVSSSGSPSPSAAWGPARTTPSPRRQRHPQARDPRRRRDLLRRGVMPPRDLPLGGPLQHPAPLILRPTVPERLREPARGYPSGSRVIKHTPCPRSGGKAPAGGGGDRTTPGPAPLMAADHGPGAGEGRTSRVRGHVGERQPARSGDAVAAVACAGRPQAAPVADAASRPDPGAPRVGGAADPPGGAGHSLW
jgi:transposase InsO family protein